jgi:hypothetical protein
MLLRMISRTYDILAICHYLYSMISVPPGRRDGAGWGRQAPAAPPSPPPASPSSTYCGRVWDGQDGDRLDLSTGFQVAATWTLAARIAKLEFFSSLKFQGQWFWIWLGCSELNHPICASLAVMIHVQAGTKWCQLWKSSSSSRVGHLCQAAGWLPVTVSLSQHLNQPLC